MATKKRGDAAASPKTGTAMTKWDEELAKAAQLAAGIEESVNTGGSFFSTRGGRLQFNGAEIPGNAMNVIILDHILENTYYEGRYDPDNRQGPACWAFGRTADEMAPDSHVPKPQHLSCTGCPMNEFGSADTGRGKACKNSRRLALLPEDAVDDIAAAQVAYLKIPVTSVKAWAGYVRQLAETMKKPPFAVLTEVRLVPDSKTQFRMLFKMVGEVDDPELLSEIVAKRESIQTELMAPYTPSESTTSAPAATKGTRKFSKRR